MMYMIQDAKTGKYSKGGCPCPTWTDKIGDAKVWKKKAFVKSHLTSIKNYRERYGLYGTERYPDPIDWIVIEAEIVPRNTYSASTFS
jgi:hypothetical protein